MCNPSSVYKKTVILSSKIDQTSRGIFLLRNRLMCSLATPLLSSLANAFVSALSVTPEIKYLHQSCRRDSRP